LDQKFRLFDGVFGASDEVLGSIGNGVDFEKRIAGIYTNNAARQKKFKQPLMSYRKNLEVIFLKKYKKPEKFFWKTLTKRYGKSCEK
jgi:hypothetical protein